MATTPKLEKTKTPGIYKRGGSYVVTFRDPSGKPRKRFAHSYGEAKTLKAALKTDVARGEFQGRSQLTFSEYARDWVQTYPGRTSKGIREETRADYAKRPRAGRDPAARQAQALRDRRRTSGPPRGTCRVRAALPRVQGPRLRARGRPLSYV